jgi:hypothetical protein
MHPIATRPPTTQHKNTKLAYRIHSNFKIPTPKKPKPQSLTKSKLKINRYQRSQPP